MSEAPYRESLTRLYWQRRDLLRRLRDVEQQIEFREVLVLKDKAKPGRFRRWLTRQAWKVIGRQPMGARMNPERHCNDAGICPHRDGLLCDIDCLEQRSTSDVSRETAGEIAKDGQVMFSIYTKGESAAQLMTPGSFETMDGCKDDGEGNIVDPDGKKVGEVEYETGAITIFPPDGGWE